MSGLGSPAVRKTTAAVLAGAALLALGWRAYRTTPPLRASLWVAGRYWSADGPTRLVNSPLFGTDREFALAMMDADRRIPLTSDVVLSLAEGAPGPEGQRRAAGYVLSPRRVTLGPPLRDGRRFALTAVPAR